MDKNTKLWLTVGAVGVVAYVLLSKRNSDTIQGEPTPQDLGEDPTGGGAVGGDATGGGAVVGGDSTGGGAVVGGDSTGGGAVVGGGDVTAPPPEVFRFSISSDAAGALSLQFLPAPNLVGDADGFIPVKRIEAGETLMFEIPAEVPAGTDFIVPAVVVASVFYDDRTKSAEYTISLTDDYKEIQAATYPNDPINLPIRRPTYSLSAPQPVNLNVSMNGWDNRAINLAD